MEAFNDFVIQLIYGSGITPNHRDWINGNPAPSGTDWLAHHVDTMLPAFAGWLSSNNLPPVVAWDGVRLTTWNSSRDFPPGTDLDGSFTGIHTIDQLGAALRDRYNQLVSRIGVDGGDTTDPNGVFKLPFDHRYWGFITWAKLMRDRFNGAITLPSTIMYDRDGTILSAIPFLDVVNDVHWRWHATEDFPGMANEVTPPVSPATQITPGLSSSAGQRAGGGVLGDFNSEFFVFHRDHIRIYNDWLARTGQLPATPYDLHPGWPQPGQQGMDPSLWTEPVDSPWIDVEGGDTSGNLRAILDLSTMGMQVMPYHGSGHNANSDIVTPLYNNFSPRFFTWHTWVDSQWWWREPRFARWNATTRQRERVFYPVLSTNTTQPWPGMNALTILRDPSASGDVVSPANAIQGIELTTGAGTLSMRFYVKDPYTRNLRLDLRADAFNDVVSSSTPVETVMHTYTVGTGGDFALETEFVVSFAFNSAFRSDDPGRMQQEVGFANSRIRISGILTVADGSDPNFVHHDFLDIVLIQEKQAPEIDLYLDLSSFGANQVQAAMMAGGGTEARFGGALIIAVQDQTAPPVATVWPTPVADELKGVITGEIPASGLYDDGLHADGVHAPKVDILQQATLTAYTGFRAELASGPLKEDTSLPDNLPQRYTYRYDIVFDMVNNAFTGLAVGATQLANLLVTMADRSGNQTVVPSHIELVNGANPYMRDGDPSWLSIDTRVFTAFESDVKFNAMLAPDQPNVFIQQVMNNLNAGTTGSDTFDNLPTDETQSALEFSTEITNPSAGTSRKIYNFALAKVRLQGTDSASNVRVFFHVFRYSATNLIFDPNTSYRFFDDGSGRKVPLLGFASSNDLISIPFFAEQRIPTDTIMTMQRDTYNVQSFPTSSNTAERVLYFGAYLDINQDNARLPNTKIAAHPDGGFGTSEVQPIRSLMMDAHQCMVVEIKYDGKPTNVGDTPANSDNLAQRNLLILTTDNPGATITHTIQHSFEADLGRQELFFGANRVAAERSRTLQNIPFQFTTAAKRAALVNTEAAMLAWMDAQSNNMPMTLEIAQYLPAARQRIAEQFPLVFDTAHWQRTSDFIDELMFLWNELPRDSHVELFFPHINCEQVINLRHLRHAPDDVKIIDSQTLLLIPNGVTYIPLPPTSGERVVGIVTITLPAGIRKGQKWLVDVIQLRGGEQRTTGGFQIDIQVSKADLIADAERRFLGIMFERLSLMQPADLWYPIIAKRVVTIRERAAALAGEAGIPWVDPTQWTDPTGKTHPLEGPKVRVVLEKIQFRDEDMLSRWERKELRIRTRVRTENNGGIDQHSHVPIGKYGRYTLEFEREIFNGYAIDNLGIEIDIVEDEEDKEHDESLGKYKRLFCCSADSWFGEYRPGDEAIDPENVGLWRVWYRIEKG